MLKFLETYAARQVKLWKVLSRYHLLPDHFHDLKIILQSEFNFLKKATSKTIENIQETVQSQQAYSTALCTHINSLYIKLAQLDRQVQTHCLYPHPQSDVVQLNVPNYNLDIDGLPYPVIDLQSLNAENIQEETASAAMSSEEQTASSHNTNRPGHQSSTVLDNTNYSASEHTEQSRRENANDYRPQLDDIPELETDEENWDEGQFEDADLIDCHNTTEESDRIHCEYSAHFEKATDQGYGYYNSRTPGLDYQIPEPEYYNSDT